MCYVNLEEWIASLTVFNQEMILELDFKKLDLDK